MVYAKIYPDKYRNIGKIVITLTDRENFLTLPKYQEVFRERVMGYLKYMYKKLEIVYESFPDNRLRLAYIGKGRPKEWEIDVGVRKIIEEINSSPSS